MLQSPTSTMVAHQPGPFVVHLSVLRAENLDAGETTQP
jgi:hypothetical protein